MGAKLSIVFSALAAMVWAVPVAGAAPFVTRPLARSAIKEFHAEAAVPLPVRFRIEREGGLLLRVWIDGRGPYVFAVDTGAGLNVISEHVLLESRLSVRNVRPTVVGGLSAATTLSNREALISQMALGDRSNLLPSRQTALVVSSLPPYIDGILDPTEVYSPLGYSIDMPNQRIEALDTASSSSQGRQPLPDSAVVPWLRFGKSNRPFVRLGDGRIALVDTGSSFGLAVNERHAVIVGNQQRRRNYDSNRDIGGGMIGSRRVSPTTISIGDLVLRGVPTDILFGVEDDAPVILGRDALYPFRITFNPRKRTIEFLSVPADD